MRPPPESDPYASSGKSPGKASGSGDLETLSRAIDAVYVYASDPQNWEEMTDLLSRMAESDDSAAFLALKDALRAHVARAEDIATRLRPDGVPDDDAETGLSYLAFTRTGGVCAASHSAAARLAGFCTAPVAPPAPPRFADEENARRLRRQLGEVTAPDTAPALVRFTDENGAERVLGFLCAADRLPRALRDAVTADAAAVLVMPQEPSHLASPEVYRTALGLTPAEARLAVKLRDGLSLKEAAADLNISINTARNQLRSIFDRLGVNRQGELIRHLGDMLMVAAQLEMTGPAPDETPVQGGAPTVRFVDLPDGRKLAYREYGDIAGTPVMLMQSSLRSSLVWPPEAEAAREYGVRLIVPERPGTGLSTVDPGLTFESFAADAEVLADSLGLGEFILSARSSAAPFALALAARLGPRIQRLVLSAARLSVPRRSNRAPGTQQGMLEYFFNGLQRHPWMLESVIMILRTKMSRPLMRQLAVHFFEKSPVDVAELQAHPDVMEDGVSAVIEAVGTSHAGLLRESALYLDGVDLDLSGVTAPVEMWHGTEDRIVPPADLEAALDRLGLSPRRMHWVPGLGHLFVLRYYREMFKAMRDPI